LETIIGLTGNRFTSLSATVDNTIIDLERCNKARRDLGVIVDSKLSFSDHITEKVNKAYSILGII